MSWVDTNEDVSTSFDAMPAGRYQVLVSELDVRQTKAKADGLAAKGELINVKFEILNDKFAGRVLFERYNVSNDSEKAQQIGRGQFKDFCSAAGVALKIEEPDAVNWEQRKELFEKQLVPLQNKTLSLDLKVIFDKYKEEDINTIKKYVSKEDAMSEKTGKPLADDVPF